MALPGSEPTDLSLETKRKKRVRSAVKAAKAVPVAKAVKAAKEVPVEEEVKVAVLVRSSSASATSSLISISISDSLETKLVAKQSRAFTSYKKFIYLNQLPILYYITILISSIEYL